MAPWRILGTLAPLTLVAALLLAWQTSLFASPMAQQVNVSMLDDRFDPPTLTVQAGSTVVWTNRGVNPHTSNSDAVLWDSGIKSSGQAYSRTFDTPGTFSYNCAIHRALGMVGTLTVVAAAQPTATPLPPTATSVPPTATAAPPTATPTPLPPTATPTPAPPTATATAVPPAAAPTSPPPTATTVPPAPAATAGPPPPKPAAPAATTAPPAAPANPAATPTPSPLPRTGDTSLLPWVLLLAGIAIVVGFAVRTAARR